MHFLLLACCLGQTSSPDAGPFVRSLWLAQTYGNPEAVKPKNDARIKGLLAKGLAKDNVLTLEEVKAFMNPDTFHKLAGPDNQLDATQVAKAVASSVPESRGRLLPKIREHADLLTTSFDLIDERHQEAGSSLSDWIVEHYQPGRPLDVVVVCTGNSRRSILGATMGNIAALYYGMPEVRFHSGGTAPTAFNRRTVTTLKAIGVEVESTGKEAKRGEPATANPEYRVRWGDPSLASKNRVETVEFSKHYADEGNPQEGFAALMVCGEADAGCPIVKGASLRVSMPYLDPKIFDDSPYEVAKYNERRDDMGRLMLSVFLQARNRLAR